MPRTERTRRLARPVACAALALSALAGCRHNTISLASDPPAHREPTTTSIYGDWLLATPADSTAFAGASAVELTLDRSSFVITATYPSAAPLVVRGAATAGEGGTLTLTPQTGTRPSAQSALALVPGRPVTVLASAAGNTMVFSPPNGVTAAEPSSVWHRKEAAKAAGTANAAAATPPTR